MAPATITMLWNKEREIWVDIQKLSSKGQSFLQGFISSFTIQG
jgi:hypothetical protein